MKRNFIKAICNFHLINGKEFCKLTEIPYRTMQNWLYEEREMPDYMEILIMSRFTVIYGELVHDKFFNWYYLSEEPIAIKWKGFTQDIIEIIELKNGHYLSEIE